MGSLTVMDVRREFYCFGAKEKECWPKVSVLTWGIQSIHVSAEEEISTEWGQREKHDMGQRRNCDRWLTVCNLLWLGPATNPVKSWKKRLHMIMSVCFEKQFCCRVLNILNVFWRRWKHFKLKGGNKTHLSPLAAMWAEGESSLSYKRNNSL